ncbi:hypothetical protein CH375_12030 [Leptospira ellisii]|uniref:Uncharacterized protein n=1 Tax=Leptospira ellisii TaxID=2023197 RepID=A0A2N0BJR6_9LEPT|nr:hypothetical protein CH379_04140 [Leptospira ellisii]PKA04265.1 hypothetical protein CH375_12030 [Leptospira ellisii]
MCHLQYCSGSRPSKFVLLPFAVPVCILFSYPEKEQPFRTFPFATLPLFSKKMIPFSPNAVDSDPRKDISRTVPNRMRHRLHKTDRQGIFHFFFVDSLCRIVFTKPVSKFSFSAIVSAGHWKL